MKQLDHDFLTLYNKYAPEVPASGKKEVEATLARVLAARPNAIVLETARPRQRRWTPVLWRKRAAVAAAAVCAVFLMAAGVFKAADLFRNVLQEPGVNGEPAPLTSMAPVVSRTGLLPETSAVSGDVQVTLQGLVGDENSLKLLLNVSGPEGKPLALRQTDGSYSQGEVDFRDVQVALPGQTDSAGDGFSVGAKTTVIDKDPGDHQLNLLLELTTGGLALQGSHLNLTLNDLMQLGNLDGISLGLDSGKLYETVSRFEACTDEDFVRSGHHENEAGELEYDYLLGADSGAEAALAPGHTLTNAAVRDGRLYLRGYSADVAAFEAMKENAQLRRGDGTILATFGSCSWDESGVWSLSFEGVETLDALEDAQWWYGAGEGRHQLAAGTWELGVDLTYGSLARTAVLSDAFTWDGHSFQANALEVSPYTLRFGFTADTQTRTQILPEYTPMASAAPTAWEQAAHAVRVQLRDGTVVSCANYGSTNVELPEDGSAKLEYTFLLDVVIDPAQVEKITIGDLEVAASQLLEK